MRKLHANRNRRPGHFDRDEPDAGSDPADPASIPGDPGTPGDLNGDGIAGLTDLLILLTAWGPCAPPPADCPAALPGDDLVGLTDLLILLNAWGADIPGPGRRLRTARTPASAPCGLSLSTPRSLSPTPRPRPHAGTQGAERRGRP